MDISNFRSGKCRIVTDCVGCLWFVCCDWCILLRRTWHPNSQIGWWLCLYYGIIWTISGIHTSLGWSCGGKVNFKNISCLLLKIACGSFSNLLFLFLITFDCRPCTCTVVALTFAIYMLRPFYPNCEPPGGLPALLATILLSKFLQKWF